MICTSEDNFVAAPLSATAHQVVKELLPNTLPAAVWRHNHILDVPNPRATAQELSFDKQRRSANRSVFLQSDHRMPTLPDTFPKDLTGFAEL
jgi:hypothetical protein